VWQRLLMRNLDSDPRRWRSSSDLEDLNLLRWHVDEALNVAHHT
jgi:hypothetical protein